MKLASLNFSYDTGLKKFTKIEYHFNVYKGEMDESELERQLRIFEYFIESLYSREITKRKESGNATQNTVNFQCRYVPIKSAHEDFDLTLLRSVVFEEPEVLSKFFILQQDEAEDRILDLYDNIMSDKEIEFKEDVRKHVERFEFLRQVRDVDPRYLHQEY